MSSHAPRVDAGAGVSFIASAVIHLAVFLLLVWWGRLSPPQPVFQETYYVDVVTLPTVAPQSGLPAAQTVDTAAAVPPVAPRPIAAPVLAKAPSKVIATPAKPVVRQESAETESAFAERMDKLEQARETRREEAVLEKLRSKVKSAATAKSGTPGAGGIESGSRYADFIKSRLEDALKLTSSYSTRNPEVTVRLTITAEGKLSRIKIERSSGDATFEMAVRRAIDLASEKFTAPPNRTAFENGFVFKPKGISNGPSR